MFHRWILPITGDYFGQATRTHHIACTVIDGKGLIFFVIKINGGGRVDTWRVIKNAIAIKIEFQQ